MLRATLVIAGKDLRQRLRDRSLFMFALVVPLGLAFLFSLVFSGVSSESIATFAVVDQDKGPVATAFVERGLRPVEKAGVIGLRTAVSPEQARKLVEEGKVQAAFVIPAGFSAAVQAAQPASLRVVADVHSPIGVQVGRALAEGFATEARTIQLSVAVVTGGPPAPEQARVLAERAVAVPTPVTVSDVAAARRELDLKTYFAAGMAVFFLFFTAQIGVTSLLEERKDGTLARLLAAPIPRGSILGAKLATSYVVGAVSLGVLVVGSSLLIGAQWGDPLGVILLVLSGVLAATGAMSVVAVLARTSEQASNWQSIVAVVLGLLGGVFFPIQQAGGALELVGYISPHRWFLRGLADLYGGGGVGVVLPAVAVLVGFGLVTGTFAVWRLRALMRP